MSDLSVPLFGPLAWIDVVSLAWFAATAVSVAYVASDAFTTVAAIDCAGFEITASRRFTFRPAALDLLTSPHVLGTARRP
ncbi:MAG: hypothetical protein ACRD0U_15195 [Acidimicrobiales bacterium]